MSQNRKWVRCMTTLFVTGVITTGSGGCKTEPSDTAASGAAAVNETDTKSKIKHVVVIVQENHTFDAYFGRYCKKPAGSNPTCTDGPECCESAPELVLGKATGLEFLPRPLNDFTNTIYGADRNHDSACEYLEMNCGTNEGSKLGANGADAPDASCRMDRYIDARLGSISDNLGKPGHEAARAADGDADSGPSCGSVIGVRTEGLEVHKSATNWAIAEGAEVATYHDFAKIGAIGDRYFQPTVGQTSSNNMFLATAQFEFRDNTWFPKTAGSACQAAALPDDHQPNYHTIEGRKTIADLLLSKLGSNGFGYYHMGFGAMTDARGEKDVHGCPKAELPALCPTLIKKLKLPDKKAVKDPRVACMNDPSDNPFRYFSQFDDDGANIKALHDYEQLKKDVKDGTLPAVVYVKAVTAVDEHPAFGPLSTGQQFVKETVETILGTKDKKTKYTDDTLVLITWDEGGGFYDHVSPPVVWDPHGAINTTTGLHTNSDRSDPAGGAGPGWMRLGTRVPIIALGSFVRKNAVSHVQMEHSSIVKFLEWNYLGGETGQLEGRESQVNNIGSLLQKDLGVPESDAIVHARQ